MHRTCPVHFKPKHRIAPVKLQQLVMKLAVRTCSLNASHRSADCRPLWSNGVVHRSGALSDTSGEFISTVPHLTSSLDHLSVHQVRCTRTPICRPYFQQKNLALCRSCAPVLCPLNRSDAYRAPPTHPIQTPFELGFNSNHAWASSELPSTSFSKCSPHPLTRLNLIKLPVHNPFIVRSKEKQRSYHYSKCPSTPLTLRTS